MDAAAFNNEYVANKFAGYEFDHDETVQRLGRQARRFNGRVEPEAPVQEGLFDEPEHAPLSALSRDQFREHPSTVFHATYQDSPEIVEEEAWGIHTGTRKAAQERIDTQGLYDHDKVVNSQLDEWSSQDDEDEARSNVVLAAEDRAKSEGYEFTSHRSADLHAFHVPSENVFYKGAEDQGSNWRPLLESRDPDGDFIHAYENQAEDTGSTSYVGQRDAYKSHSDIVRDALRQGKYVRPQTKAYYDLGVLDAPEPIVSKTTQFARDRWANKKALQQTLVSEHPWEWNN